MGRKEKRKGKVEEAIWSVPGVPGVMMVCEESSSQVISGLLTIAGLGDIGVVGCAGISRSSNSVGCSD